MTLALLAEEFAVCKVTDASDLCLDAPYCFIAKTNEELSLVCRMQDIPSGAVAAEPGWRAFKIHGPLDFSMVGVLARLAGVLAQAEISIFAVSTYDTDYVLVRSQQTSKARMALESNGYAVTT